jgi:hypothetical protein
MKKQNKLQKLALQIGMICGIMTAIVGATKETFGLIKDWVGSDKEEISKMKDEISSLKKEVRMLRREVSDNSLSSLVSLVTRSPVMLRPPTTSAIYGDYPVTTAAQDYPVKPWYLKIGFLAAMIGLLLTIVLAVVYHYQHRKPVH